jgi:tetratricopeptide (TPR) repeat protein
MKELTSVRNLLVGALAFTMLWSCGPDNRGNELSELQRQGSAAMTAKRYAEAEPLIKRSQALWISMYGNDEAAMASIGGIASGSYKTGRSPVTTYDQLARCYEGQGKFELAEPLRRKILALHQRYQGQRGPLGTSVWENTDYLAANLAAQKKFDEAIDLYKTAMKIKEASLNPDDFRHNRPGVYEEMKIVETVQERAALAEIYRQQGHLKEAEELFVQLDRIDAGEPAGGPGGCLFKAMHNHAKLLRDTGRVKEADALEEKARFNENFPRH